ncbi:Eco57I restriction-modification methylase domain-containing protein [Streptomyces sp. NPDC088253]|uniref:Eco57I restriction-modification methylase domain-containing protein n=1 Tax=Streptomyces sp. NPDC088253 TaxID=3365846 RepID=UPI0038265A66
MSATARNQVFSAVHTVGGLLPADMLVRISEGKDVPGSKPADYGVIGSRSVRDDAERHWDYLKAVWRELRTRLPEDEETGAPAADPTGIATAQWLEPLFKELDFGRLTTLAPDSTHADGDADKTFPISHRWQHVLIHLTRWNADLDKRPGGAGTVPPQSMVQECLNRTEAHQWGVLTNGRQLRLLRDSSALATASYVEFDLEAIFDGELFSEFVLLYRLLHVSRFEIPEGAAPSACRLEKWRTEAIQSGTRALEQLRKGVQDAITTLGTGFLRHPDNSALRADLNVETYHYALLRLVYRLLFLFVAEDREALLLPTAPEQAKDRYARYFSSARLRRQAQRRRGTAHGDLYRALGVVLTALGHDEGRPELGLPGLGGIYDDNEADKLLHGLALSNEALLAAVRALSVVRDAGSKRNRVVDYRHLDAEELGSIYESLLELVPKHSASDRTFELVELPGNARKTTGSYYTPSSLIDCLLDSALDPVIDDAVKRGEIRATRSGQPDPRDAIVDELLSLTVCDPACGSGHFLVAAARRIAKRVAAVREQNPEPTLDAVRHALHEVVARCVYGVDLNPMAVELAKVSLWLEALEPGKPLGFLDAHIKHGNALIGATPALLAGGIPDDAFKPIEGDDKKVATYLKKLNAKERSGQSALFDTDTNIKVANSAFATGLRRITAASADTLKDVRLQSSAFRAFEQDPAYLHALHVADAWCAAFVWPKTADAPSAVTQDVYRSLQDPEAAGATAATNDEIIRLAKQYHFFHWHLEFPEVFRVPAGADAGIDNSLGWAGGFSCILGNPPWEKVRLEESEFFAGRSAEIAAATGSFRKELISRLEIEDPELYMEFSGAKRRAKSESLFSRESGRFKLTGRGDVNTYTLFSETFLSLTSPRGRVGAIVPPGIATGEPAKLFFAEILETGQVRSIFSFRNADFFPNVAGAQEDRFCLLTLTKFSLEEPPVMVFHADMVDEISIPERQFSMSYHDVTAINPNSKTCPVFTWRRDAEIAAEIYRKIPVLAQDGADENPWGFPERPFTTIFHMTSDSALFIEQPTARQIDGYVPLYEGKMIHHFNHRHGSYASVHLRPGVGVRALPNPSVSELDDADFVTSARYWVPTRSLESQMSGKWSKGWFLGWRDSTNPANARTMIAAAFPRYGAGHKLPIAMPSVSPELLLGAWSSMVFDYCARQKLSGTSMTYFIVKQLPVPRPQQLARHARSLTPRLLELTYTTHDMALFARDLGDTGAPFRWDEDRRAIIRAELDALFFHLYGIARDNVDYILETFPIVKRKDEARYGSYRTKELILNLYDRMAAAGLTLDTPLVETGPGATFTSDLTPPPGQGPRHQADRS